MAWSTIRKATAEDYEKLEKRAAAFIERHDLRTMIEAPGYPEGEIVWALEDHLSYYADEANNPSPEHTRYLRQLWKRVVIRALRHPWADGISHGYVGYWVDD